MQRRPTSRVQGAGGKLILYPWLDDPAIFSGKTITYYNQLLSKMVEQETEAFAMLYWCRECSIVGGVPTGFVWAGRGERKMPTQRCSGRLNSGLDKGIAPTANRRDRKLKAAILQRARKYPLLVVAADREVPGQRQSHDQPVLPCVVESK